MRYDISIIESIKKMRRSGLTLGELARKFSISKTTVWYHVKDIDIGLRGMGSIRKSIMDWDFAKKLHKHLSIKLVKSKKLSLPLCFIGEKVLKKIFRYLTLIPN